jgi:hypothetical protein
MSNLEKLVVKSFVRLMNDGYSEGFVTAFKASISKEIQVKSKVEELLMDLLANMDSADNVNEESTNSASFTKHRYYSFNEVVVYMGIDKAQNKKLYNQLKSNFNYAAKNGRLKNYSDRKKFMYDVDEVRSYIMTTYRDYLKDFDLNTKCSKSGSVLI